MKKRILSVVLGAVLVFCLALPVLGAEELPRIYVSVFDGEELTISRKSLALSDEDGDGALTVNDALILAHAQDCPGGYAYDRTVYGLSMKKLWGKENGGAYGYYVNNSAAMSLSDPVKDGDSVYAFAYGDTVGFSDTYCYFDREEFPFDQREITLTLTSLGFDASFAPVTAPVAGAQITFNGTPTGYVTDEKGTVTVSRPREDTLISARKEGVNLLPPVCLWEDREEKALSRLTGEDAQAFLSDTLAKSAGDGTDWAALALLKKGQELDFTVYAKALSKVYGEGEHLAPATRLRTGLLLRKMGAEVDAEALLSQTENKGEVMSLSFGLLLRRQAGLPTEEAVKNLLALQHPDGGFSVVGDRGECDATAFALQALAGLGETEEPVKKALSFLEQIQNPSGDFTSYGTRNSESCAAVLMALCALGKEREPLGESTRNALLSYQNQAGGFSHTPGGEENLLATAEACCALVCLSEGGSLYDFPPVSVSLSSGISYRVWGSIILAVLCLAGLLFFLLKKRKRDALLCLCIGALLAGGLWLTDFRTPEAYGRKEIITDPVGTVTLRITAEKEILPETEVQIRADDTVYTVLTRGAREKNLRLSVSGSGQGAYIRGIGGIFEFDGGPLSGWTFTVNGEKPDRGAGTCTLRDGDRVEWVYDKEAGRNIS